MIQPTGCLIELHYLPCLAWFTAVQSHPEIILEKHEHYCKQTYRNRCHILGANRVEKLIIPVTLSDHHTRISDLRIDYTQKWLTNHWRSIESAYRKAPFFEHYADTFQRALFSKYRFLYDLNYHLLEGCLKFLNRNIQIRESTVYEETPKGVIDLRNQVSPKHTGFSKFFHPVTYTQVFGNSFIPNLSIIDLLFCVGPESSYLLEASGMHQ